MKRIAEVSLALPLCVVILLTTASWGAISITATGSWSETVDQNDLSGGAGSDLIDTYESATNQIVIGVTGTQGDSDAWQVAIKKVDGNWHINLHLHAKRTSDGSGTGSISGGTAYAEVTASDQVFFTGSGDRTGIDIQQKITGVSIQVPSDTYTTTVYYTLIDI